jgi:hypothetical protein
MKTEKEIVISELETLIYLAELSERTLNEKKLKRILTYIKNN